MSTVGKFRGRGAVGLLMVVAAGFGWAACGVDDDPADYQETTVLDAGTLGQTTQALAGNLDTTFGTNGITKTWVDLSASMEAPMMKRNLGNGKIVLAGSVHDGISNVGVVAQFNADGSIDLTFNEVGWVKLPINGSGVVNDLAIGVDNSITVVGRATNQTTGITVALVARVLSDGKIDQSFGGGGISYLNQIAPSAYTEFAAVSLDANKIVVAGRLGLGAANDLLVARFLSNGQIDTSFFALGWRTIDTAGGAESATDLILQADGRYVVTGSDFPAVGGASQFLVARFLPSGALDTSFSGDGIVQQTIGTWSAIATGVVRQTDGKLVVGGYAYFDATSYDAVAVRYLANGTVDTGFGTSGLAKVNFANFGDYVYSITGQADGKILLAGSQTQAGGAVNGAVIRLTAAGVLDTTFDGDGRRTISFSAGPDVSRGIAALPTGEILVSGNRDNGFDRRSSLARLVADGNWDTTFSSTGRVVFGTQGKYDIANRMVTLPDGKILVVGSTFNGFYQQCLMLRYTANGQLDTTFSGDGKFTFLFGASDCSLQDVAITSDGKYVAVTGFASSFAIARVTSAGALDGTFDSDGRAFRAVGNGGAMARVIKVQPDGKMVIGGEAFRTASGGQDYIVARLLATGAFDTTFSGDGWAYFSFGPGTDSVFGLDVLPDGRIIAAGNLSDFNGHGLVRFLANGSIEGNFGVGGYSIVPSGTSDRLNDMLRDSAGNYVLVGNNRPSFFSSQWAELRTTANGFADPAFATSGVFVSNLYSFAGVAALTQDSSGRIIGAGQGSDLVSFQGCVLNRLNNNGTVDTTFGGGDGFTLLDAGDHCEFADVTIQPVSGQIVATGGIVPAGTIDESEGPMFSRGSLPEQIIVVRYLAQ